ncbi:M12 family metallopeptidase [Antarctobacter heliothermus]|uniref:Astacin (Peptidase family M12A) n=1 Tax=Antarctobacter heliothermus TaxID=74033 RepID=A0A239C017_9RHOB|nr:M12 family metallopeptidase [Antarctobacter heliothermus]SNS13242.1 Astacin (Peptidase family M12A) [Antarctobacter heliothermus]
MARPTADPRPTSKYDRHLSQRLDQIEEVLAQLSAQNGGGPGGQNPGDAAHLGQCDMPKVPERVLGPGVSDERASLIRYVDRKWVNGTTLRYFLFDDGPFAGDAFNMDKVREGFQIWADVGIGLNFEETEDIDEAEVRIGFQPGGSWSYVGRDVIDIPGQNERTMNIGWDLRNDPRGVDTAVHEIGHTLGFPHEHQNPFSGIVWDEDAVYAYFAGPPNSWSREQTFHNVLRKLTSADVEGSEWDPDSVMHYGFGPGLILEPDEYRTGLRPELGLSDTDKAEVKKFYPKAEAEKTTLLEPFKSAVLDMMPADQVNFLLQPTATRDYTIRSFGRADMLMVLFRKDGETARFMAGSDDAGTEDNAEITIRLLQGEEYILRVRMMSHFGSGRVAVMYW